jgi:hypothetical protein
MILKNLCSAVIFFTFVLIMPSVWMAEGADVPPQVFVGETPSAITVQRGLPVKVPIFFVGGTFANKNVELFIYRTDPEGNVICYGPEGWESDYALCLEDMCPLGCTGMPEYIYLYWPAIDNSQSLSDCSICVCVDDQIDGVLTMTSYTCGCQSIIIEEVDDNSTGDDGTGDSNDDGTDDSGGGIDPMHPVAPPFPDLTDDSGGTCNSLEFTIEGTTFSQSSISRSLELDESEQITLLASACGSTATVSTAYNTNPSVDTWLSAGASGGKLVLGLDAGVTGIQSGSIYTGAVTVTAGGITDTMSVTLRVEGVCDPTSASVSPASLAFNAYVGGTSPGAQTIRVKDNCGDPVSATVSSKPDWLALSQTGTGVFSASCVDSYLDEVGSYSGSIILIDGEYGQRHTVAVTLEVLNTPPPPTTDDSVTSVKSGVIYYEDIPAGQARYFRFTASVTDCLKPIQLSNTSMADQPRTVHMLIKRGSKPTINEFEMTWGMEPSDYDCTLGQWIPAKPSSAKDLYWKYNIGPQAEFVEIREPMASNTFYIMLYNNGLRSVKDQRLIVKY